MGVQDPHPFNFVDLKDKNLQIDSRSLLFGAIFLVLLLVSAFSFLYFVHLCIRRGQLQIAINARSAAAKPPPRPGLDKATINCLPIVSYGSGHCATACRVGECSICLGVFRDGEKVKVLPLCHHGFHSECVDRWLQTRSSCPLCRASVVRVDSVAPLDVP